MNVCFETARRYVEIQVYIYLKINYNNSVENLQIFGAIFKCKEEN